MATTKQEVVRIHKAFRIDYNPSVKAEPDKAKQDIIKAVARYLIVDEKFEFGDEVLDCFLSGAQIKANRPYSPSHYKADVPSTATDAAVWMAEQASKARAGFVLTGEKTLAQQLSLIHI